MNMPGVHMNLLHFKYYHETSYLTEANGIHLQNMSWYFGYDMLAALDVDNAHTHTNTHRRIYKITFGNRKLL